MMNKSNSTKTKKKKGANLKRVLSNDSQIQEPKQKMDNNANKKRKRCLYLINHLFLFKLFYNSLI